MEGSVGVGFMAVFAVSGSVVFIAREVHKHLLSEFMKKIEFELGGNIITTIYQIIYLDFFFFFCFELIRFWVFLGVCRKWKMSSEEKSSFC